MRIPGVWRTVASVVFALVGFSLYVWFVGATAVVDAVSAISGRHLASLVVLGLVPIVTWGMALWVVLRRIGTQVSLWDATVLFAAMEFVNAVTPFGQSGGTPVSSLLVSWQCDINYERAFAAVVGVNVFVRLASVALGLFVVGFYSSRFVVAEQVRNTAAFAAGVTFGLLAIVAVLWAVRHDIEPAVGRGLGRLTNGVGRWLPGVSPPTPESVAHRVERFVATLDELAADPWRLVAVFVLSLFGQLSVAAALWTALDALGVTQPLPLVLVVVPLAKVSGFLPTPGSIGSAVVVLSSLIVALSGISGALATAAALVYRGVVYWFPASVGALATAGLFLVRHDDVGKRRSSRAKIAAFVLAGGISLTLLLVVHSRTLLVEPSDAVVHVVRDVGLGVLGFALLWTLFTTVTTQ
ncbi:MULTISPECIES: lysylphosphatidylglycerol synthase transmembrane domain-containing protein [Haloferax]|nr:MULTISPECIES: lysylphosphatidylglycerol synthase transmembrane domain-containing protein [Haloferax]